jgi:hypothetical protein
MPKLSGAGLGFCGFNLAGSRLHRVVWGGANAALCPFVSSTLFVHMRLPLHQFFQKLQKRRLSKNTAGKKPFQEFSSTKRIFLSRR